MSTLPYQDIKKLVEQDGLIAGADLEKCLGPASYELRIGSAMSLTDRVEHQIALGQEFAIKPQSHILLGTIESVKMPNTLAADLSLKSKFGRKGFLPWSQGFVDPGFQGKLTISLINMSPYPEILTGGQKLCHIIFRQLKAATQKAYDGEYNKSMGATGPKERPMLVLGSSMGGLLRAGTEGLVAGLAEGLIG
jgi:deoxycytidine triphosphate deaminase